MQFRYYVTSLYDSSIMGTNDEQQAIMYAMADEYYVVDVQTNSHLDAEYSSETQSWHAKRYEIFEADKI